ncbi:MAG: NAD kinase [Saprospiraceae bacterium]|nr:NAD kinase [Candidatus Vicinibacter affinis]MBP6171963.1 NAD kinase [Saprospiraceae bacterium]MBK6822407.1 NAD kinase [Candidatus Vicinibacter affinis]MBK7301812.1 NAD kinase [Candidatus Vicinibacter affinis]MBK7692950.1 NAD kinase [Candidatus Vicinibacter affinis]
MFGQKIKIEDLTHLLGLLVQLNENRTEFWIFKEYLDELPEDLQNKYKDKTWATYEDIIRIRPGCLLSLGGDGTILQAVTLVRDSKVPILGINMGRLGFLASIEKKLIPDAIYQLVNGSYEVEERSLLKLDSTENLFGEIPIALNDFTILKRDNSSMITIHTYINGDFLNSYWADGLIVASPTGSTGYSLSCGGPIIFPDSSSLVITPVAPHNLNVRPIIIPDHSVLTFEVEGRSENFLCTLDSRKEIIHSRHQLAIRKCEYTVRLIQLQPVSFLKTIHTKLNWGLDQRN